MIARYSRPEMAQLFSEASRLAKMLEVELACQQQLAETSTDAALAAAATLNASELAQFIEELRAPGTSAQAFLECIAKHEATTRHETLAFLNATEELRPALQSHVLHLGLTSSDVLDTALALQLKEASKLIEAGLAKVAATLAALSQRHRTSLMRGRTHGMTAEPTTFGFKIEGFRQEFLRAGERLRNATAEVSFGKLSGAVGTAQFFGPQFEAAALARLGLSREPAATQVVPRDRHAALCCTLAVTAGSIERLATELRHLQRSEVSEVREGFASGQQGSSAMPHKKNPISAENLTGCARLLRSNALAALENQALWHERDMSHSSVERIILPDSFILLDYALHRLDTLLKGLEVDTVRMMEALRSDAHRAFSSQRLFELLSSKPSPTRQKAYAEIQAQSASEAPVSDAEFSMRSQRITQAVLDILNLNANLNSKRSTP